MVGVVTPRGVAWWVFVRHFGTRREPVPPPRGPAFALTRRRQLASLPQRGLGSSLVAAIVLIS